MNITIKKINSVLLSVILFWASTSLKLEANVFQMQGDLKSLEMVMVGNPGNNADVNGCGSVSYYYRIGKYGLTNAQYVEFLNAKAKSDPFSLYPVLAENNSQVECAIVRKGIAGQYFYGVQPSYANRPVDGISYSSACRFVNWLNNGQGAGDTENGAYALNGRKLHEPVRRTPGVQWFLPNENEWYKAAFYDPNNNGHPAYWHYPARNNSTPMSASSYGTFDQSGNVWEWSESGRLCGDSSISGIKNNRKENVFKSREELDDFSLTGFRIAGAAASMVGISFLGPDRAEKADLYLPTEKVAGKRFPGVVIIHGSGWVGGSRFDKREVNIGTNLAEHGYVAMSIDYLLASENNPIWPRNLYDCKTAVRWLRKNADLLKVDPNHIGVIGGSAGGHLAAMVGVTEPGSGLDPNGPYGEYSCRVQAVVDLYGPVDLINWQDLPMLPGTRQDIPKMYEQASPGFYADKDDPPILIVQGDEDLTVNMEQSRKFSAALQAAGTPSQLVIIKGLGHSFHLQPEQCDLRPLVIGFFDENLGK